MKAKKLKKLIWTMLAVVSSIIILNLGLETTNSQAGRQPGDYLNQDFWDNYSSTGNIIAALYGDGTPGSSAYNRFWTGMNCNITENDIVVVTPNNHLNTIITDENKIYLLLSGTYNISYLINPKSCSAIIGKGDVTFKKIQDVINVISLNSKSNIIIDNIKINGNFTKYQGIYLLNSHNNTINNIEVYNNNNTNNINYDPIGIYLEKSNHNSIHNNRIHDNEIGIELKGSNHNYINNSQIYNNDNGIQILGSNGSNTKTGSDSNYNTLNNLLVFNNNNGIILRAGDGYDYQRDGGDVSYNTIINSQIFNNIIGIKEVTGEGGEQPAVVGGGGPIPNPGNGGNIMYNMFYNNTLYNNNLGLQAVNPRDDCNPSTSIFGSRGIFINQTIKDSYIYNSNNGFQLLSGSKGSYISETIDGDGEIFLFDNNTNFKNSTISIVGMPCSYISVKDELGGTYTPHIDTENTSYHRLTNPINANGDKFLNGTNWSAMRGTGTFFSHSPIKYVFGKNIPKQIQPIRYNSNGQIESFGILGLDRDPNDYIAAVNMETNPNDANIINYYYGPQSEFTTNWNANNCSLGAFTVQYIHNQTEFNAQILSSPPGILGHTIYVLSDGIYNIAGSNPIMINDNCVAIVNQGSGATITRTNTTNNPVIKINGQENVIINNLNIDGNTRANHGILLEKVGNQSADNNTINNSRIYNNTTNGIMLGVSASYNTIMNTQTRNNGDNGIEIYLGGKYNIINNSLSYNNQGYGIRFGNISKYNTINNSQFFNNGQGGIFSDFTTEQNIINNIHTYNNGIYGINFKRSSGNNLNNIYSYNNQIGINITDTSCVNNMYNGDLILFDNSQDDLVGTNGNDTFLTSAQGIGNLTWYNGHLETGNNSMSCTWATNPRYIGTNTTWFLDIGSGCNNTGIQNTWNPNNPNNIEYMFGLGINKQIAPVGHNGANISLLSNQYNANAYVGEINPIIRTYPGNVIILSGYDKNLDLDIAHEMIVLYDSGMLNHNFDLELTLHPNNATGYIETQHNSTWQNIGTGTTGIDFSTLKAIKIVIQTPNTYYETVSGTLYFGTNQYGYNTATFDIRTKADDTPPSIIRDHNFYNGGVWFGQTNSWQATVTGIYNTTSRAQFVTGADACNTGIILNNPPYLGTLHDITLHPNYHNLNQWYICVVAKDNINNQYTTGLSNQILISKIEFIDPVESGPVNYDIIDINFQNVQNFGYRWINSGASCNSGLSGTTFNNYTQALVISDISLNGKYLCTYAQDGSGSGKYLASTNKLNIIDYSNTVKLIDDVSPNRVNHDIISVYFSPSTAFSHKQYKWVNNPADCSNTNGMVNYTGTIDIDHQGLNDQYFCLYTREQNNGLQNYLLSTYPLKIDSTNPTEPTIVTPTSGQTVYRLTIKAIGASDGESGLTGFEYEIAQNATFLDVITSGSVYTTGETFSPIFNNIDDNYAIRVRSIDNVGNKSIRSNIVDFNYKNLSNFKFQDIHDAQLGTAYTSNEIVMGGLGVNEVIQATVSTGILLRNGNSLGSGGLIQNNDKLSIKMISSANYSGTTQSELKIANKIIPWMITTIQSGSTGTGIVSGCNVSPSELLTIQTTFNSIVNMYSNPIQLQSFLLVMKSMLQDNIALNTGTNTNNLECLLYLIDSYINTNFNNTNSNIHKTPNCKQYTIVHDTGDNTYYSPNTVKQVRFGSRDELVKYLDVNNPGDCHINVYGNTISYDNTNPNRHIAPNGKVYRIESNNLGYSSPDFINIKYFASVGELRAFIDKNNPAIIIRDHTVDATFTPITHTAPNGKTYKIYKTNRGYMSYKLMKVQYFSSLEELTTYINKNNK